MNHCKKIKICFLTTIDTNVGDDWIREGIVYLIETAAGLSIDQEHVNIHDWKNTILDSDGRDKISSSHAIVMAGTPFYFINERNDVLRKLCKALFSTVGLFTGFSVYDGRCSGAAYVKPIWYDRIGKLYKEKPLAILAAGTNLGYASDATELLNDRFIRKFLRDIHSWSCLNTVRESLAARLLTKLDIAHSEFPCTAFWSMNGLGLEPVKDPEIVAFNYMAGGGHYRFDRRTCSRWESVLLDVFRRSLEYFGPNRVKFVCHDQGEADIATRLVGSRHVWYDGGYAGTLAFYGRARTGLVNRCHALVAMAGYGAPSVVVGKDSRTLMASEIGLPRYFYEDIRSSDLFEQLKAMYEGYERYNTMLTGLKEETERSYVGLIREKYVKPIFGVLG